MAPQRLNCKGRMHSYSSIGIPNIPKHHGTRWANVVPVLLADHFVLQPLGPVRQTPGNRFSRRPSGFPWFSNTTCISRIQRFPIFPLLDYIIDRLSSHFMPLSSIFRESIVPVSAVHLCSLPSRRSPGIA